MGNTKQVLVKFYG